MTRSTGRWMLAGTLGLAVAMTFAASYGRAVADEERGVEARREQALARREKLTRILADYLAKYPEADLDHDGQLTNPERTKHISKLYRIEKLKELGDRIRFTGDIEYARVGDVPLTLDLYLPPKVDPSTRPRLVAWFHGGGWRGGSKDKCILAWLATEGFAVASVEYRSTLQAAFPANIHDCKGAIRWLRANAEKYGFDARMMGVGGASAGGHLAAILGTSAGVKELEGDVGGNLRHSSRVQAVLNMSGVIRIADWPKSHLGLSTILSLTFSENDGAYELARLCSPDSHITGDDPPLLILHGDADKVVPLTQSLDFLARYTKAGLDGELRVLPGTGHVSPKFSDAPRRKLIRAFFDEHLRGSVAADPQPPRDLLVEGFSNPIAIDRHTPAFSWKMNDGRRGAAQSAYRILAASRPGLLAEGKADLWDSGKVDGDQSLYIPYAGRALASGQQVAWTVRVWDQNGLASPYGQAARFQMALLDPADWSAKWIGCISPRTTAFSSPGSRLRDIGSDDSSPIHAQDGRPSRRRSLRWSVRRGV